MPAYPCARCRCLPLGSKLVRGRRTRSVGWDRMTKPRQTPLLGRGAVLLSVLVGFCFVVGQARRLQAAQATPTTSPGPRSNAASPKKNAVGPAVAHYITGPVPLDRAVLGPHFLGHDIRAVVRRIAGSPLSKPKSEFETAAQYAARMSAFRDKDFQYVFVIPNKTDVYGTSQQFSYDADGQTLTSSVSFALMRTPEVASLPDHHGFLMIRADCPGERHYVGVNALGVRRNIARYYCDTYELILADPNGIFEPSGEGGYEVSEAPIRLQMNTDQAQDLEPNLRIAIVCTVTRPKVYEDFEREDATITNPSEYYTLARFIEIRPDQVWVFDSRTGRIVSRRIGAASTPDGQ